MAGHRHRLGINIRGLHGPIPARQHDAELIVIAGNDSTGTSKCLCLRIPSFGNEVDQALSDMTRRADDLWMIRRRSHGEYLTFSGSERSVQLGVEWCHEGVGPKVEADILGLRIET